MVLHSAGHTLLHYSTITACEYNEPAAVADAVNG